MPSTSLPFIRHSVSLEETPFAVHITSQLEVLQESNRKLNISFWAHLKYILELVQNKLYLAQQDPYEI